MPTMPRMKGKATKIAFAILGKPANLSHKPSKKEQFIDRRLLYEETYRVK